MTNSKQLETTSLSDAIFKIFLLIGVSEVNIPKPETIEFDFLFKYFTESLPKWTPSDIVRAFHLYVSHKLETTIQHYGKITIELIEVVMNAYSVFLHLESKSSYQEPKEIKPSQSDIDNFMWNQCLNAYSNFKEGILILDLGSSKYDWMNENQIISLTPERKRALFAEAKNEVESELREERIRKPNKRFAIEKMLDNMLLDADFNSRCVSKAKYKALILFFTELRETDQELSDILN